MSEAVNKNIGEIKCPFTGGKAYIRKARKGRFLLYLNCPAVSPQVFMKTEAGQQWILEHGRMYSAAELERLNNPEPAPAPAPKKTEPTPAPAPGDPENQPKKSDWRDSWKNPI
jgi:hypothetical protein